jgi:quaternary ammonium compound-resistance protein SugE
MPRPRLSWGASSKARSWFDPVVILATLVAPGREDDFASLDSIQGRPWQLPTIMPWILLIIASLFEVAWAVGLKFTDGFTRLWPTIGTVAALLISVALLGSAAKSLPIGTAYAVWTGLGAAGTVICGIIFLGDPATVARLICAGLILAGVIGLKMT